MVAKSLLWLRCGYLHERAMVHVGFLSAVCEDDDGQRISLRV